MEDPKRSEQHWQDLAELFGLPPEKTESKPASAPVAPAAKPVEQVAPVEEPAEFAPMQNEEATEEVLAEEGGWEEEFDADSEETRVVDVDELADESVVDADTADFRERAPVESAEEERPKRGRRRRRRGRRRGGEQEGRERTEAAPRQESRRETAPDAGDERHRGRHRGRRRDEEERQPAHEDAEEAWSNRDERDTDSSRERPMSLEDTDFSNWNVPSWQELIASLYRPDR